MVFYTQEQQVKQKVKQELFDEDTKRSTRKITSRDPQASFETRAGGDRIAGEEKEVRALLRLS